MGKRFGRKKTLKSKKNSQHHVNSLGSHYWCQARGMMVDSSVCVVYQVRNPHNCFGCKQFKG